MGKIVYEFLDGTKSEVIVDEQYLLIHQELERLEKAQIQKEIKQKWRGGYKAQRDFSLDKHLEECGDVRSGIQTPLEFLVRSEDKFAERENKVLDKKNSQVYRMWNEGYKKVEIAKKLGITESAVRQRIKKAEEQILEMFE